MTPRAAVTAGLLAVVAGACSAPPALPLSQVLSPIVEAGGPRLERSLAIAPLEVAPSATELPADPEESWRPVPAGLRDLEHQVLEAARASSAFAETEPLDAVDAPEGADRRAVILDAAFAAGADCVLIPRLTRHAVRYEGHNGRFAWNIANFILVGFTAWFVADERYAGELALDLEVLAVGTGRVLLAKRYQAAPTKDLDHFARGWKFFGTFTVPGSLDASNYEAAGRVVLPYARNEVLAAAAADLATLGRQLGPGQDPHPALASTLAVIVGVERHAQLPDLRVAGDDARAVVHLLAERAGVPDRNVVILVDRAPTRSAVLAAIRERAARARPGDTVLFYFAGYGFARSGRLFLAPYDLDPVRPEQSAIGLRELGEALASGRGRQVVVLDTSFEDAGHEGLALRTLRPTLLGSREAVAETGTPERELAALGRGRTAIVAAKPGTVATEQSPLARDKRGLFTARLADAVETPGTDEDRDGQLSLLEVFERARRDTRRLAGQKGIVQEPALFGDPAAARRIIVAPAPEPTVEARR